MEVGEGECVCVVIVPYCVQKYSSYFQSEDIFGVKT